MRPGRALYLITGAVTVNLTAEPIQVFEKVGLGAASAFGGGRCKKTKVKQPGFEMTRESRLFGSDKRKKYAKKISAGVLKTTQSGLPPFRLAVYPKNL